VGSGIPGLVFLRFGDFIIHFPDIGLTTSPSSPRGCLSPYQSLVCGPRLPGIQSPNQSYPSCLSWKPGKKDGDIRMAGSCLLQCSDHCPVASAWPRKTPVGRGSGTGWQGSPADRPAGSYHVQSVQCPQRGPKVKLLPFAGASCPCVRGNEDAR
jgi:hypothetical protein